MHQQQKLIIYGLEEINSLHFRLLYSLLSHLNSLAIEERTKHLGFHAQN
jgi:hypothetical protein